MLFHYFCQVAAHSRSGKEKMSSSMSEEGWRVIHGHIQGHAVSPGQTHHHRILEEDIEKALTLKDLQPGLVKI